MKVTIVGSGLSGATAAVLASRAGHEVDVWETRPHIGGNCYDSMFLGTRVHNYGAHIFHTNDEQVWQFLNQFTAFNDYRHEVVAEIREGSTIPVPFNDVSAEIVGERDEDWIVDNIFRDYTKKQWGVDYDDIPKGVTKRNSLKKRRREGRDCRYFFDTYQGIPINGYTAMFEAMLEDVNVITGCAPDTWRKHQGDLTIYTGPVDAYFDYGLGPLQYRSLRWDFRYGPGMHHAVTNYCSMSKKATRAIDHSFWHPEDRARKGMQHRVVSEEFAEDYDPRFNLPIYPVPFKEAQDLYARYRQLAISETGVIFLGRLATYKYIDMWVAVRQAMDKLTHYFET